MGKRVKRQRVNPTGRNNTDRFVRLSYRLLCSNAYRSLSPNARSLLVELAMLYNGDNNGSLYLGVRDAAHRMGLADLTAASRAFDDLKALGFVQMTRDAHFCIKAADAARARCWRLTWQPGPGRKIATWDFLEREAEPKTPARKRMERGQKALKAYSKARSSKKFPVLDCGTTAPFEGENTPNPVAKSDTLNQRNGGNLPILRIPESDTYLAIPEGRERSRVSFSWWQPDWSMPLAQLAYAHTLAADPLPAPHTSQRNAA
ncbi:MAG: hypothetical protein H2049_07730 [Porphyrobacter sp.]|nr:hypothetical protein [Porphyrobacter sp.]